MTKFIPLINEFDSPMLINIDDIKYICPSQYVIPAKIEIKNGHIFKSPKQVIKATHIVLREKNSCVYVKNNFCDVATKINTVTSNKINTDLNK